MGLIPFLLCFKQAVPLVNAFATMCGLVVPIALAHAGCASLRCTAEVLGLDAPGACSLLASMQAARREVLLAGQVVRLHDTPVHGAGGPGQRPGGGNI